MAKYLIITEFFFLSFTIVLISIRMIFKNFSFRYRVFIKLSYLLLLRIIYLNIPTVESERIISKQIK